ncbi:hypothetical protein H4Q26_001824 [Puccinia striiformis f. sp. tritici PST-130]|nr:hypothetical protein H4Q26_001824 [Puccinia striiformis f. sp. tritici PST-130]
MFGQTTNSPWESVPSSFSFPVDSETTTVADLKRSVLVEVESNSNDLLAAGGALVGAAAGPVLVQASVRGGFRRWGHRG